MKKIMTFLFTLALWNSFGQCVEVYPPGGCTFIRYPNGDFKASGYNNGAFGNGTTANSNVFVDIGNHADWTDKISWGDHTLAIKTDGSLWGWGSNTYGQLADPNTSNVNRITSTQIGTDTDWAVTSGRYESTLALKSNGTLWSCGRNNYGQLGLGNNTNTTSLTQVGTDNDWAKIETSYAVSFAIKTNGTLWMWGMTANGLAGDGTAVFDPSHRTSPQQVGTDSDWLQVKIPGDGVIALKSNGTIWAWGGNAYGTLGDGTTNPSLFPKKMGTDNDWVAISALSICFGLKSNGTLWSWSRDYYGSSGQGFLFQNTYILSPIQIGTDTDWISIKNLNSVAAQKQNGNYFVWGINNFGQFGDGTTNNRYEPELLTVACLLNTKTENNDLQELTAFPNPTSNFVNLKYVLRESGVVTIQIFNYLGQIVSTQSEDKVTGSQQQQLDLTLFNAGIYIVTLKINSGQQTLKIIKN
ncbi:MAG: T9SS type A sorting domain-containing protein [Flavobacterium sp.]|nr:T9SS type A sorting domain-containing protein [Flavobacterium sp.]